MSTGTFTTPVTSAGTNQATATPIVRVNHWTICMTTNGGSQTGVLLPPAMHVGDLLELHATDAVSVFMWPSTGDNINLHGANNAFTEGTSNLFRCTSVGNWTSVSTFTN